MAIEIKELVVRFTIEQPYKTNIHSKGNQSLSNENIKGIINHCTEAVLTKLKRIEER